MIESHSESLCLDAFQQPTSRMSARRRAKRSDDKRIASLVAKEMAKVIPQIVAQVHSLSNSRASEDVKTEPVFLYKHFKARDPMPFTGEECVSQLLQWFDAIEFTLRQSGCPENFRTTCATGVLQSRALDWWTAERNKRGITAAYTLSWNELKVLMKKEYCPPHEVQKLEDEFWNIKQDEGDNAGYTVRFKQLSVICCNTS
ncbi:putative retrotransposon gag domain-containing protein [Helianthus anomalus]